MGRVKEFALWLADCVYQQQMSDEAIVEFVNLVNPHAEFDQLNRWLIEQIQIIRRNPKLYDPSDDNKSSTCGRISFDEQTVFLPPVEEIHFDQKN